MHRCLACVAVYAWHETHFGVSKCMVGTYPHTCACCNNIHTAACPAAPLIPFSYITGPTPAAVGHCLTVTCQCLQSWIDDMSKYLKKADPNHMITVGEEGFYTKGSSGEATNPGTGWASLTGQDFIANHASPAIDFAAAHIWPDNWEVRGHLVLCTLSPSSSTQCSAALFIPQSSRLLLLGLPSFTIPS